MNNISSPGLKNVIRYAHQDLYKSPNRIIDKSSTEESPSWRNAYKKRCFDEFKKSRIKLVNKFRCLQVSQNKTKFRDYIQEELEKICILEAKTNPDLISIDEAIIIYKQIQAELIPNSNQDEDIIKELLENENIITSIVCPVCQKANIVQDESAIYCENKTGCILRINLSDSNFSLIEFAARLEQAVKQHPCNEVPSFKFKNLLDKADLVLLSQLNSNPITTSCFLLMSCGRCQYMQSIL